MKRSLVFLGLLVTSACSSDTDGFELAMPMRPQFESSVHPILLRDCGFPTCHGSAERQFRVWGPGRVRADPNAPLFDPVMDADGKVRKQGASDAEVRLTLDSATGFIDARDPRRSLLLRKPLATEAGGTGHLGVDRFGRNVYSSMDSEGYLALSSWVFSLSNE